MKLRTLLACAGIAASLALLLGEENRGPDSVNYEVIVRSLILDGDLFLANDLRLAHKPLFVTATGYPLDIHNIGVVFFWAPFYVLAHAAAKLLGDDGGLGAVYVVWLRFADWLYGLVALLFTYAALRRLFERKPAALAAAAVAAGSPFVYYMGVLSPGTHMVSAFLSALFLYAFLHDRESHAVWIALGVVGGLALTVANTNVGLLALPLVDLVRRPDRIRFALLFALFYALSFAPQAIAWYLFTGNALHSPYSGQVTLTQPHLLALVGSSYHGAFVVAPLLLLAFAGLFLVRDRAVAAGSALAILAVAYLASCNIAWWGGGSFGIRYLVGATPFFALGLAALLARFGSAIAVIAALCIAWTLFLYLPYADGSAALSTYYPLPVQLQNSIDVMRRFRFAAPSTLTLLFLPLFTLIALAATSVRVTLVRKELALVPLVLLAVMLVVAWRSDAARAACDCTRNAIRSDIDQWDLGYSYAERARYRAERGDRAAALADLRQAVRIAPGDAGLRAELAAMERAR
jgi:Dolichyl-phosphate-mannose-protein mannosyltransferase